MNVYQIGATLSIGGNAAQVMAQIAGQFLGLNRQITVAQAGLRTLQGMLAGLATTAAGLALGRGVAEMVREGGQLVRQQVLLRAAGEDNLAIQRATMEAYRTAARIRGVTPAEALRDLGDMRGLFGSLTEAQQLLEPFTRISRAAGVMLGRPQENMAGLISRVLDQRNAIQFGPDGRLNTELLNRELDAMWRAMVTNRGRVGPQQFLNFIQQGGNFARLLSPEAFYGVASVPIESMGGHRAGTGMAAMMQQLMGGMMTSRTARELIRYGIVPREGIRVVRGGQVQMEPNAVEGGDLLRQNPHAWVQTVLIPALQRQGAVTQEQQLDALSRIFGRQTAQRFVGELLISRQQIEREIRNQQAVPADSAQRIINEDPTQAMRNLSAAWDGLMQVLGAPLAPVALSVLNSLSDGISSLTTALAAHPDAAAGIAYVSAGLAALLTAVGGLAVARISMAAVGALFGAAGLGGFFSAIGGAGAAVISAAGSALGLIGTGIAAIGAAIVASPVAIGATLVAVAAGIALLGAHLAGYSWSEIFDGIIGGLRRFVDFLRSIIPEGGQQGPGFQPGDQQRRRDLWRNRGGTVDPASYVPDGGGGGGQTTQVNLMLDGQRLASVMMDRMGRVLNGPMSSSGRFDTRRGFMPPDVATA